MIIPTFSVKLKEDPQDKQSRFDGCIPYWDIRSQKFIVMEYPSTLVRLQVPFEAIDYVYVEHGEPIKESK